VSTEERPLTLDELYAERDVLVRKKYDDGLTLSERRRLEEVNARLDEEESKQADLSALEFMVEERERVAKEVWSVVYGERFLMDLPSRLRDTVTCPGPLYGTVEPARSGVLFEHAVGSRRYVFLKVFGSLPRWTLHRDDLLLASGDGGNTSKDNYVRLIFRDAGILRSAWSWLTDFGARMSERQAARDARVLFYDRLTPKYVCELIFPPSERVEWCLHDEAGNVVASGAEANQDAAMNQALLRARELS